MNHFFSFIFLLSIMNALPAVAQNQMDQLPLNQIQVIGSHNSYKKTIDSTLFQRMVEKDTNAYQLQYEHQSILEQLEKGLRNLEIDVFADTLGGHYAHPKGMALAGEKTPYDPDQQMEKPGFKVLHMPDVDYRTWYYTFKDFLVDLRKWSENHPDHIPVFITLEAKDGVASAFGTKPQSFSPALFDELDLVIRQNLGVEHLITPDEVRGNFATLEEAVLAQNWPKVQQVRGKVIFVLNDKDPKMSMYLKGHPSLAGRMMFVNADPGNPEAAIMFRNDPTDTAIPSLVKQGYIIRTRADAGTTEARQNDYSRFKKACQSGAQIITTDYYEPSHFFDSPYHISFSGNSYVRANQLTGGTDIDQK